MAIQSRIFVEEKEVDDRDVAKNQKRIEEEEEEDSKKRAHET